MSIDLDKIEKVIKEHLEDQPYKSYCSECGADLDTKIEIEIDSGLDMIMTITPCDCVTPDSV